MEIHKLVRSFVSLSFVCISIFIVALWITLLRPNPDMEDKLDYLKESWSKSPIFDIVLSHEMCPMGYSPEKLGETEELLEGYDCGSNSTFPDHSISITDGNSCRKIEGRKPKGIFTYRGDLICTKRDTNYLSFNFEKPGDGCVQSDKPDQCQQYDSLGNSGCFLGRCPIQEIYIIDKTRVFDTSRYQSLEFSDGKLLIFSNQVRDQRMNSAIIGFKLQIGNICADPREKEWYSDYNGTDSIYPLIKYPEFHYGCKTKINGFNFNPHFSWIDRQFGANLQPGTFDIFNIPSYPYDSFFKKPEFNLYVQHYPGVNLDCYYRDRSSVFNQITDYVSATSSIYLERASLPMLIMAIFVFVFGFILGIANKNCYDNTNFNTPYVLIFIAWSIASVIVAWIYYARALNTFYTYKIWRMFPVSDSNFPEDSTVSNCFDAYTAGLLTVVGYSYQIYFAIYLITAILFTIIAFTSIIFPLIVCFVDSYFDAEVFDSELC